MFRCARRFSETCVTIPSATTRQRQVARPHPTSGPAASSERMYVRRRPNRERRQFSGRSRIQFERRDDADARHVAPCVRHRIWHRHSACAAAATSGKVRKPLLETLEPCMAGWQPLHAARMTALGVVSMAVLVGHDGARNFDARCILVRSLLSECTCAGARRRCLCAPLVFLFLHFCPDHRTLLLPR